MEGILNHIETIKTKEQLKELEATGDFLFHGSPHSVSEFEPRQAYTEVDGKDVPDGEPAVFASAEIEVPIFRSIFHESNLVSTPGNYRIGIFTEDSGINIHANQEAINVCQNRTGYVYVLKRSNFTLRENTEWISNSNVVPVAVFNSSFRDIGLPITVDVDKVN
ncbi:MAG: hypothetical protein WAW92_00510 [Minisyncoccia bacterium]